MAQFAKGFLSQEAKIISCLDINTAAATDRTSYLVDTQGYNRVLFIVKFGAIVTNAVTSIKLSHSDAADDTSTLNTGADIADTSVTVADDDDNQIKFIDIMPSKRYLQLTVDKDATNNTTECVIALAYNAAVVPVTHADGSGVGDGTAAVEGETHAAAVSGTA